VLLFALEEFAHLVQDTHLVFEVPAFLDDRRNSLRPLSRGYAYTQR
jgi:hypothetical protein